MDDMPNLTDEVHVSCENPKQSHDQSVVNQLMENGLLPFSICMLKSTQDIIITENNPI